MLAIDSPLVDLVNAVKQEVFDWGEKGRPIYHYGFGFYRLPFFENRFDTGQALHVWLDDLRFNESPHTHIFSMTSRVLLGGIQNNNWVIEESPKGDQVLSTPVHVNTSIDPTMQVDRFCFLYPEYPETILTGGTYAVPLGVCHSSKVLKYPTVTLIDRQNIDPHTPTIRVAPRHEPEPAKNPELSVSDYQRAWRRIKQVIAVL